MAKKTRIRTRQKSRSGLLFLVLAGLALAAIGLAWPRGAYTPEVRGGASLRVDREQVDFGDVPLGTPVSASFTLTNVGDRPLRFAEQPWIEVKDGC